MPRHFAPRAALLAVLSALPVHAAAQSTISGLVTDPSGAPIANVSVDASSPSLIERSRTAVTSAEGRYAIVDVRPGLYAVRFTADGFAPTKRTVEVAPNVTVPVDAQMQVGSVAESVDVKATDAVVDVQNATHPVNWTREDLDALPTARNLQSVGSYAPGVHLNIPDVGGSQQIQQTFMSSHGSPHHHVAILLDGLLINTTQNDGQVQTYIDNEMIQGATYSTTANPVAVAAGGVFANMVPKDGGNTFRGDFFAAYTPSTFVANNLDAALGARGFTAQAKVTEIQDFDGSIGGPLRRDAVWYVASARRQRTFVQSPLCRNADGSPCVERDHINSGHVRLTFQVNRNHKLSAMLIRDFKKNEDEVVYNVANGVPATVSASSQRVPYVFYIAQTKWTGVVSPKLLLQAGLSINTLDYRVAYQDGLTQTPFTPAWYSKVLLQDTVANLKYNVSTQQNFFSYGRYYADLSGSYVTGAHQLRFGVQDSRGPSYQDTILNGDLYAMEASGRPTSVTVFNTPVSNRSYLNADFGAYAQDTWTTRRLTITPGIRWEYLANGIRPESAPAGRFVPARSFAAVTCATYRGISCFKTWAPRLSAVYDVFGSHKTAIKASVGKYEAPLVQGNLNPFNPMLVMTQSRAWINTGGCTGPACFPTDDQIGPAPSGGFGTLTPRTMDPNHRREYNVQYTLGVQHQVTNQLSLNVTWMRRDDYQQTMTVNQAVPAAAWTPVTITNPLDGTPITLFNLDRSYVGVTPQLYLTNAPRHQRRDAYIGVETAVQGRLPHAGFFLAAWTVDRQRSRHCEESTGTNSLSDPNSLRFCDWYGDLHQDLGSVPRIPYRHEFKLQATMPLPYRFEVTGSVYSDPVFNTNFALNNQPALFPTQVNPEPVFAGAQQGFKEVYWTLTSTTRYPTNCNCSTPGGLVDPGLSRGAETILLVAPGTRLTPRLTQVDLGIRRRFTAGRSTVTLGAQLFNLLNSNIVTAEAQTLGASIAPFVAGGPGGVPTAVLNPRLVRIAAQVKF